MRTVWYCGINENNVVRTYVRSFGDDGISIFFGHMKSKKIKVFNIQKYDNYALAVLNN